MGEQREDKKRKKGRWKEMFLPDATSSTLSIEETAWRARMAHEIVDETIRQAKDKEEDLRRKWGDSEKTKREINKAFPKIAKKVARVVRERWRIERKWEEDWTDSEDEFVDELLHKVVGKNWRSRAHYSKGILNYNLEWYDDAIGELKKAVQFDANYAEAHDALGLAYAKKGMYDQAVAEHKKALEITPRTARVYVNLAGAYLGKGMQQTGLAMLNKAITIDPECDFAHYNLAIVYYYVDEYDLAVQHCDTALRLGCDVPREFLKLLKRHRKKGRKKQ